MRRGKIVAAVALGLLGCELAYPLGDYAGGPRPADAGSDSSNVATNTTPEAGPEASTLLNDAGSSRYRNAVLQDNPSVYFRMGEGTGSARLTSEVGAQTVPLPTDGITLGTAGALAGDPNAAVTFAGGILTTAIASNECQGTSACTVEFWIRIEEYSTGFRWIVDHEDWSTARQGWLFELNDKGITYERWDGQGGDLGIGMANIEVPLHEWHHVASVVDDSAAAMYWDGVITERNPTVLAIPATNKPWTLGAVACTDCGDRNLLNGSLDEFAIYEHALTANQLMAHVAAAK